MGIFPKPIRTRNRVFSPLHKQLCHYAPSWGAVEPMANATNSVSWSPDGEFLAYGINVSPFIVVFRVENGRVIERMADPASLPAGQIMRTEWSPDGSYLAAAHDSSPYVSVWAWSTSGFGSKVSNPGTLPTGNGTSIAWHPLGTYLAVSHTTSPYVSVYPWSGGFGSKVANPADLPAGNGLDVVWLTDGSVYEIVVGSDATPYVQLWDFTTGFGTRRNPSAAASAVRRLMVLPRGDAAGIFIAQASSPYLQYLSRSINGAGTFSGPANFAATSNAALYGTSLDPETGTLIGWDTGWSSPNGLQFRLFNVSARYGDYSNYGTSGGYFVPGSVSPIYAPGTALSPDRRYLAIVAFNGDVRICTWDSEENDT